MPALFRILVVIPAGFIAACLAAATTIVAGITGFGPDGIAAPHYLPFRLIEILVIAAACGAVAAVPMLVAAVLAEAFALRSLFLWLGLGAAIAAGAALLPAGEFAGAADARLLLAGGLCGGFIYWLVAGRSAGSAIAPPDSTP